MKNRFINFKNRKFFLGVDVGGTKSHALIADETGQAVGSGMAGPGSWEGVGYDGLADILRDITVKAMKKAGTTIEQIAGAGLGMAGFDWPSQRQSHLDAIHSLGLQCRYEIVNDAILGILAGAAQGWGISVVSGTGCNCRGWSKDHKHEGRMVGGASFWSGEAAGGFDIVARAMRAVTFEWNQRGPATALTQMFLQKTGAKDLDDLIEGLYLGHYDLDAISVMDIFHITSQGDNIALDVMRWAGDQLGQMACGVINQLGLQKEIFDVVLIGSLYDGHPMLAESLGDTVHMAAPGARLVRLTAPPVVGGVLLGMQTSGFDPIPVRTKLIETTRTLFKDKNSMEQAI